jgi:aspartate aminotransferase
MRRAYRSRRDRALTEVDSRGVGYLRPPSTFYGLVEIGRSGESSVDVPRRLLEEQRVDVVPGSAFGRGGERMVRLSFAASDSAVTAAVERLARAIGRRRVAV